MANGHGGYRRPTNPAATSGPGKYSRRTDGQPKMQLPDAGYGEQAEYQEIQGGARMGAPAAAGQTPAAGVDPSGLVSLDAPTGRPGEPVTAGAPLGPGVGPEAIGLGPGADKQADLQQLKAYLPVLIAQANRPDSTRAFRNFVRRIRAEMQ
jgi:hypothetical protein